MKTDTMTPIPFEKLLNRILDEYAKQKTIFGIRKFYKNTPNAEANNRLLSIFGEKLEMPFGPAAGPHTQLAQNIIAAYVCGSRFFELKTVQILDGEDLPVSKPCIIAEDEAYNCEWSTELYVPEAFDEYVKAWFLLHILATEFSLGSADGFIFNMSVGYDLEGIKTKKIDCFIEGLKNASNTAIFAECKKATLDAVHSGRLKNINAQDINAVKSTVCKSITLSTLHGCPPDEIERIANYLLTEKKLHTFIKCNPTLLGYDFARTTLDNLGFDYIAFDEHHFNEDLQFADAVPMLERLQKTADSLSLSFGVKLTNTFPVDVKSGELPSEEMYMSGRSLAPLSLALAKKLSAAMDGKLRISYSGGADVSNIVDIFSAGIWPITLATSILKPGGYERLVQIAELFEKEQFTPFTKVDVQAITQLADNSALGNVGRYPGSKKNENFYKKPIKPVESRKLAKSVPLFDCFTASCSEGCPIHQDIPAYIRLNGEGKYTESLQVITDKNPLPFITGTICAHPCMNKCTRSFYDTTIYIRGEKLKAAEAAYNEILAQIKKETATRNNGKKNAENMRLAIIGAGPAGLSAAYLASREGIETTVFEKRKTCGGIVRHVIPGFRISDEATQKDVELAIAAGANIVNDKEITSIAELFTQGFTHVIVAVGAWQKARLDLEGTKAIDALDFLMDFKLSENNPKSQEALLQKYGTEIIVVGGGNTAMDTARAAKHIPGVKKVSLVYRRTKRYMPADEEELVLAIEDGVEFCELLAPTAFKDGKLTCDVMELGEADSSGRKSPQKTGKTLTIDASTVIAATGSTLEKAFYTANNIALSEKDLPILSENLETSIKNVYIAGDGVKGSATVVEAIADAAKIIKVINVKNVQKERYKKLNYNVSFSVPLAKKGLLLERGNVTNEAQRCLECSTVCELCCDVCPNRANVSLNVEGNIEIVHIDDYCNECGNCTVFCPYESSPYKDKFTLFRTNDAFSISTNSGFVRLEKTLIHLRLNDKIYKIDIENPPQELQNTESGTKAIALIKKVWYNSTYLFY